MITYYLLPKHNKLINNTFKFRLERNFEISNLKETSV